MAHAFGRTAARDPYNAFIRLFDRKSSGIAVAVKDTIDVAGVPTTGGALGETAGAAERDADLVAYARTKGAYVVGKTNLDPWGFGARGQNPLYGDVINPSSPDLVAGGSSAGSAAAVAAGMCDWAVGTDSGGSLRIPAAFCGVVGFKPTQSLVSRRGVLPLAPTLDVVGPIARSVAEAASALEAIAPSFTAPPPDGAHTEPLRLAVPGRWIQDADSTIAEFWRELASDLSEVTLPPPQTFEPVRRTIMLYESSRLHAGRCHKHPELYLPAVRVAVADGLRIDDASYQEALERRVALQSTVDAAMDAFDALILPTTARLAPPAPYEGPDEPLMRFTAPFSLTGHPVLALPICIDRTRFGIQLVGRTGHDEALIALGVELERRLSRVTRGQNGLLQGHRSELR